MRYVVLADALVIIVPATKVSALDEVGKDVGIFIKVTAEPPAGVIVILIPLALL
jgi:hypothetical protein